MPKKKETNWLQMVLMYPALIIALIGAVPKYTDWVQSIVTGKSETQIKLEESQAALWVRNMECDIDDAIDVKTSTNTMVSVALCPTGDMFVRYKPADVARPFVRWVTANYIVDSEPTRAMFGIRDVYAAEDPLRPIVLADTRVCQALVNGKVIRVIRKDDGSCVKEVIDAGSGNIDSIEVVACSARCE
ncbi:MAG: hypothetical protein BMS9Abin36_1969 [Gammaproteobacteria bacterium]|nr:MAG: hypothetical protein BMS9Abin36_1969 [Gammaproteobacteria bacterium]